MKDTEKTLDLKVTVTGRSGADPDTVLAKMDRLNMQLTANPYVLKVTRAERADGQPFGLEAEFEEYWGEVSGDGRDGDWREKDAAYNAFMYGVKYGMEKA